MCVGDFQELRGMELPREDKNFGRYLLGQMIGSYDLIAVQYTPYLQYI